MTTRLIAPLTASALAWALFAGCSPSEPEVDPDATTETTSPEMDQIELIRQLPEAEVEIALTQRMCPVSGEPLGSMGVPIKVDAKGTPVFLCCDGCKDAVAEDPDAILAKVPQGNAEAPEAEATAPETEGA